MSENGELILCLSTVASSGEADRLAAELLQRSLAACVQIDGPIRSHYVWKGQVQCDQEYRLMIKSSMAVWDELKRALLEVHPYEEPQVVMVPIADAADGYRQWVLDQTKQP